MKENENTLTLPERLTIETITPVFNRIKKLEKRKAAIEIDFQPVKQFDSSAIALVNYLKEKHPDARLINVSPEWNRLFSIFPGQHKKVKKKSRHLSIKKQIEKLGEKFMKFRRQLKEFLVLLADEIYHSFRYVLTRRGVYPGEVFNQLYLMGYKSVGIISIMIFLVGLTVSITSAQQLKDFGADIYLADLVGYGMLRELVPLMTGIILAGKIGASITAEIASMKVLEETDALKTMGIVPEKFLMVPRLLAMTYAIPLLTAIADFVGIFAGVLVGAFFLDIPPAMFFSEMFTVVDITDVLIGLSKSLVFGWIVVISAGYKGFSVRRGAAGVGIATTESVVLSISLIILADCAFAIVLY